MLRDAEHLQVLGDEVAQQRDTRAERLLLRHGRGALGQLAELLDFLREQIRRDAVQRRVVDERLRLRALAGQVEDVVDVFLGEMVGRVVLHQVDHALAALLVPRVQAGSVRVRRLVREALDLVEDVVDGHQPLGVHLEQDLPRDLVL